MPRVAQDAEISGQKEEISNFFHAVRLRKRENLPGSIEERLCTILRHNCEDNCNIYYSEGETFFVLEILASASNGTDSSLVNEFTWVKVVIFTHNSRIHLFIYFTA